jgi:hypothetical protein
MRDEKVKRVWSVGVAGTVPVPDADAEAEAAVELSAS